MPSACESGAEGLRGRRREKICGQEENMRQKAGQTIKQRDELREGEGDMTRAMRKTDGAWLEVSACERRRIEWRLGTGRARGLAVLGGRVWAGRWGSREDGKTSGEAREGRAQVRWRPECRAGREIWAGRRAFGEDGTRGQEGKAWAGAEGRAGMVGERRGEWR